MVENWQERREASGWLLLLLFYVRWLAIYGLFFARRVPSSGAMSGGKCFGSVCSPYISCAWLHSAATRRVEMCRVVICWWVFVYFSALRMSPTTVHARSPCCLLWCRHRYSCPKRVRVGKTCRKVLNAHGSQSMKTLTNVLGTCSVTLCVVLSCKGTKHT